MRKTAGILILLSLLSKTLGFVRELFLAYYYGASNISDAYLISSTIPILIFGVIGAGIATGYIPIYNKITSQQNTEKALEFTNKLIISMIMLSTIVVIVGLCFTDEVIKLFASGFDKETFQLSIELTKITLFSIFFSSVTYILTSYLQICDKFYVVALTGIPLNVIVIYSIYLSQKNDLSFLAYGIILSSFVQMLIIVLTSYQNNYKFIFRRKIWDKEIKEMLVFSLPVMIGISMDQINAIVDRTLASNIIEGGISALNYANKLNGVIQSVFIVSIISLTFPKISKMVEKREISEIKKILTKSLAAIFMFVIPITLIMIMFPEEIVSILFGRGSFDSHAVELTSDALFFYSFGILAIGVRELLIRVILSFHDSKTPVINSTIAMAINVILNIILSKFFGIGGLALATSISAIFATLLMWNSLKKKIGGLPSKLITLESFKIILSSIFYVMSINIIQKFLMTEFDLSSHASFILSGFSSGIIYMLSLYILKFSLVYNVVNNKFKN